MYGRVAYRCDRSGFAPCPKYRGQTPKPLRCRPRPKAHQTRVADRSAVNACEAAIKCWKSSIACHLPIARLDRHASESPLAPAPRSPRKLTFAPARLHRPSADNVEPHPLGCDSNKPVPWHTKRDRFHKNDGIANLFSTLRDLRRHTKVSGAVESCRIIFVLQHLTRRCGRIRPP